MPTTRELRDRIGSIDSTMKITNAMYLISSTKMRKAKTELAQTEPYFYTLQSILILTFVKKFPPVRVELRLFVSLRIKVLPGHIITMLSRRRKRFSRNIAIVGFL